MPRQARLDSPGALHHIMVRGINREAIFRDTEDKSRFLERLAKGILEARCSVYAWVILDNHAHLLFKSGVQGISSVMRKLLTWYAQYFNRRYHRTGHVFENRYKSILCEEDRYLLALVRYIHLNPVRAQIVATMQELEAYPWSGHRALVTGEGYGWMDTDHILLQFGGTKRGARSAYRKFVEEGMTMGSQPELTGGGLRRSAGGWSQVLSLRRKGYSQEGDERILGSGEFVQQVLREVEEKGLRQLKLRKAGMSITHLIEEECRKRKVSRKEIEGGSRRAEVSRARAAIARRAMEDLGLPAAEVARYLGVNTSSIIRAAARAAERAGDGYAT